MKPIISLLTVATLAFAPLLHGQDEAPVLKDGIQGKKAPKLNVSTWIQLPGDKKFVEIDDYAGKTLILLFFQHECEASQKRALPTYKILSDKYDAEEEVAFLAVQTAFQKLTDNTASKLEVIAEKFKISTPIGHHTKTQAFPGINGDYIVAEDGSPQGGYEPRGTPWWVVITPEGEVEFNGSYLNPTEAQVILDGLTQ